MASAVFAGNEVRSGRLSRMRRFGCLALLCVIPVAGQQIQQMNKTLGELRVRVLAGKQYRWTGTYSVAVRSSEGSLLALGDRTVEVAHAEGGKEFLHMKPLRSNGVEYTVVSNGTTTWSYLPERKEYSEDTSASTEGKDAEEVVVRADRSPEDVMSALGQLIRDAQSIHSTETEVVKIGKSKESWPIIDLMGKPDADGGRTVTRIVMAPDRPVLRRLTWAAMQGNDLKTMTVRVQVEFDSFSVGETLPAELFTFEAPKRAKLVEQVNIPGQAGSVLLNHASPEIELRTLSGEKFKLSNLQGKVVVLNFWASWCPPCRAELPMISKLSEELKDKGVAIFGVNDEDVKTARKYLEGAHLNVTTLDDSAHKVHAAYRVHSIPTVFVIGPDGKVVQWLKGGHSEKSLRAAILQAGHAE